jgi:hypothetical protein
MTLVLIAALMSEHRAKESLSPCAHVLPSMSVSNPFSPSARLASKFLPGRLQQSALLFDIVGGLLLAAKCHIGGWRKVSNVSMRYDRGPLSRSCHNEGGGNSIFLSSCAPVKALVHAIGKCTK